MDARTLKQKYLAFFESKQHAIIPSAPLIPENDPTVLFITAGMQPIVPFLSGTAHPLGVRLVNVQKCIRTIDLDEVGDTYHHTLFEMLGNWSLGDYFKKEAIEFTFEFFTKHLEIPMERLAVTCFEGNDVAPKDEEAALVWKDLGFPEERIAFLGKDNWWELAGDTGPCGPSTEIFYWKPDSPAPAEFDADDDNWVELGNNVLMAYEKINGKYQEARQKNIDFGGGVERIIAALNGFDDNYLSDIFQPLITVIEQASGKTYAGNEESMRIIADHMKAATFLLGDEKPVTPSNVDQGYVLRRLIRRAIRHCKLLEVDLDQDPLQKIAEETIKLYGEEYPSLAEKRLVILDELAKEQKKFLNTIEKGMRVLQKEIDNLDQNEATDAEYKPEFSGKTAFLLFQSYGFPLELTQEILDEKEIAVDVNGFEEEQQRHQELSRKGAEKKFKGGLADDGEATTKLHTATHLLNEALRKVVDPNIVQRGSNITAERLRFDFNFDRALTQEEKQAVEDEVNRVIQAGLSISKTEMTPEEAKEKGAQSEFGARYPPRVSVYMVGDYSMEICMGPHVKNTKEIGSFKIKKEQSSAAGIRRIKAVIA